MANLDRIFSQVTPTPSCDACAGPYNLYFALGTRVYGERVWLCSIHCLRTLRKAWYPNPIKRNRGLLSFIRNLFVTSEV